MADPLSPLPSLLSTLTDLSQSTTTHSLSTVDSLLTRLTTIRSLITDGSHPGQLIVPVVAYTKTEFKEGSKREKEWKEAVGALGKSVDRKFNQPSLGDLFPPPPSPPTTTAAAGLSGATPSTSTTTPQQPFSSPEALTSLHESISTHLSRTGSFSTLPHFLEESSTPSSLPPATIASLEQLWEILRELERGVVSGALKWVADNLERLGEEGNELEFELRKEEFIRLLLSSDGAGVAEAIRYGGYYFKQLWTPSRSSSINALLTSPLYLPLPKLLTSPYSSLFYPYSLPRTPASSLSPLQKLLQASYLKHLGLPKDDALSVVTSIGGLGAISKILKVGKIVKEGKASWSGGSGELPVVLSLPAPYQSYHSIFACPVSKEQSTPTNPPMLLGCGHVLGKESLTRLGRGGSTIKCPYCPIVSQIGQAVKVHF